jgi:CRP/FNR family transcriptional regulator, anaerobic regulatory protein
MTGPERQPMRGALSTPRFHAALPWSNCNRSACFVYEFDLCGGISKPATSDHDHHVDVPRFISSSLHTLPARRAIVHPIQSTEFVLIICDGWAARLITAPSGHKQIVSFLLPGDLISAASPFESSPGYYVEAITGVTYRKFKQSGFKAALFECRPLLEKLSLAWIDERVQADQLALNLGEKGAERRIAWLILSLANRLAKNGMASGDTIDFPLRQRHIASAVGLTPAHVSKVLTGFQRDGLIEISDRSLRIIDKVSLQKAAGSAIAA